MNLSLKTKNILLLAASAAVFAALAVLCTLETWRLSFGVALLACAAAFWYLNRAFFAEKLERFWLLFSSAALLVLCIAMPVTPSVSWDGQIHYDASVALATYEENRYTKADTLMADSDSIYDFGLFAFGTSDNDWAPNWATILSTEGYVHSVEVFEKTDSVLYGYRDPLTRLSGATALGYTAIGRIPNAVGLLVGEALDLPHLATVTLGRVTGAAAYIVLVYAALKVLRRGKHLLFTVASFPTMLFMAANYSYDPTSIALIMLGSALALSVIQTPGASFTFKKGLPALAALSLGVVVKPILFLAIAILFAIPGRAFASKRSRRTWCALVTLAMLAVLATFALPFLTSSGTSYNDTRGGTDISATRQIGYILAHPVEFVGTMTRWAVAYLFPASLAEVPLNLCYLPRPFGWPVASILEWGTVIALALSSRDEKYRELGTGRRVFATCALVAALVMMAVSLYLSFSNVGAFNLNGMQPRYLLMVLFPLFAFCPKPATRLAAPATAEKIRRYAVRIQCGVVAYVIIFGFFINML